MIEKVLVLAASIYDFTDRETGEIRRGTTVHVLPLDQKSSNENTIGIKPTKFSMSFDDKDIFKGQTLPAYAEMTWTMDFNRMKPVPVGFENFVPLEGA